MKPSRRCLQQIAEVCGFAAEPEALTHRGSGFCDRWVFNADGKKVFLKTGRDTAQINTMLSGEAEGLTALARCSEWRVPAVYGAGVTSQCAWLAMEYLELQRLRERDSQAFGHALATLHGITQSDYGWHRDNTIGSTPQINTPASDWAGFFCARRLEYQLRLLSKEELRSGGFADDRLLDAAARLLAGHAPPASLLHGDLWAGNVSVCAGRPAVYDPAVYFGDRETDLAMMRLFGGFGESCYAAYEQCLPLTDGAGRRRPLYQLYHILNHVNLFGGAYLSQASDLARQITHSTS